jgi:uncharacterized protein with HEPN domain
MIGPLPDDSPDVPHLWSMREAALGVIRLTRGVPGQDLATDPELLLAVERGIGIIGNAARLMSQATRDRAPRVAWRQLAGAARLLADDDDALEADEVWRIVETLPALVRQIAPLIQEDDDA